MKIDKHLLTHVADVARINLTENEIEEFLPQLKEIITSFSELSEIDTEGIKPSFHPIELKNALREDIPKTSLSNEDALKNTIYKQDGYFKGPRVL
jgi:aspartyl-tRNA(Asn)/glutamyl-tRNA(Gln) amidotransferase subunit C